jgi:hypothetical protein
MANDNSKKKYEKLLIEHNQLQTEYDALKKINEELETRLKKYTSPERNKKYYQKQQR